MSEGIPQGWQFRQLGEFAREIKDKNGSNDDIPVLSVTKYDGFVHSLEYFKKRVFSRDTSGYKKVTKGDFAYATIHLDEGSLGLLKNWNAGLISPMYTVFRVNEQLNPDFLFFLMKSDEYMGKYPALGQGSINRRASIAFSTLSQLDIHYPPLPEQQKIASILTSVDEVIEKTEAQISKLQDLKKGMMQELLTKGIGHTEFKDSPVGRIPKGWGVAELGSLFSFKNGVNKGGEHFGHGVPIISYKNVYVGGGLSLSDITGKVDLTPTEIERFNVCYGDVFFTRTSETAEEIGLSNVYLGEESNVVYNGFVIRARPMTEGLSPEFCKYCFSSESIRQQMVHGSKYTTRAGISSESLGKIRVTVPPLVEQEKIAEAIGSIEASLSTKNRRLAAIRSLKKSLMQDLLTGKVRVKVTRHVAA